MPRHDALTLLRYADTVIVGGGTSGAVVAGRLTEQSDRSVLLLEAGPDYGPYDGGAWPRPMLDARTIPYEGHHWGYTSAARHGAPGLRLERARVLGGCSSHNGCAAIWGSRVDYDEWELLGNSGWSAEALLPFLRGVNRRLRVRVPTSREITPWHRAVLEAAPAAGVPVIADLNDLDEDVGVAPSPVNIAHGVRWNTALAYLDPVRDRSTLSIHGNVLADRLLLRNGRVVGLEVIGPDGPARIETPQVVLSAGAYGSPAILLRSGIGDARELDALGIEPIHMVPGVGRNLHDHPSMTLRYAGTPALVAAMQAFEAAGGWLCEEQTIAKARSSRCQAAFDLHLYPVGGPYGNADGSWMFLIPVANMTPLSRGTLRLAGRDPEAAPIMDHGYLTDPDDRDLDILMEGVDLARTLAAQAPLADVIGEEMMPGDLQGGRDALRAFIRTHSGHYYHPVGTCKMGPASDPNAVVDDRGQLHGVEGLFVADASIMPVIPRANTNIPCAVVGEKLAAALLKS